MNRMTRDYCSKNSHPKWRNWEARYDQSNIKWSHIGNFCKSCNKEIFDVVGSGSPESRISGFLTALHGKKMSYTYLIAYISKISRRGRKNVAY